MNKTKKKLEKIVQNLSWKVWREDVNARKIVEFNVFNNCRFCEDVINDLLKCSTKEEFSEKLRHSVMYTYWCRSEFEVIVTSWPPYITYEELNRLNRERVEYYEKWGHFSYRESANLDVGKKVDIYQQLMLNWNAFVDYIYNFVE